MALKFLNKKGWHTGSLRNIENVWKAEQKHEAEQKKLEELRKQIQEEKERAEFRLLQEQAGLVPKQERLDFLYDSGLSVGKGNSEGFKALETFPKPDDQAAPSSSSAKSSVPGALFEEKPQSANDAWRKLHSDPLLMIRQREQEALARIKKNPVQMAMIRKSVEGEARKHKEKNGDKREGKKHREGKTHRHKNNRLSSGREESDSGIDTDENRKRRTSKHRRADSEAEYGEGGEKRKNHREKKYHDFPGPNHPHESQRRKALPKLSEEERAARLREMQVDAELHEEQRWKRLKKAEEDDAREAVRARASAGRSFLDAAQKSVYGAEKGGSSTIEESVRRRAHYSQGRLEAENGNAFRR